MFVQPQPLILRKKSKKKPAFNIVQTVTAIKMQHNDGHAVLPDCLLEIGREIR